MSYIPDPLDTTGVALPEALLAMGERLAEQVHATWARQRLSEGWRYGPRRDDERRTHPGLVPYAELTEAEKAYDRQTALESIRLLLALGYRIVPPGASGDAGGEGADASISGA